MGTSAQGIRRLLVIPVLLLFCCLSWATVPVVNLTLTADEKEWLIQHPVIPLGADGHWPPIDFYDDYGRHSGVTADYITYLQNALNVRFELQRYSNFAEALTALKRGDVPVMVPVIETPERRSLMYFSQPFFSAKKVLVSYKSQAIYNNLSELAGRTLSMEKGIYLEGIVRKQHPDIRLKFYDTSKEAVRALLAKEVDAYLGDEAVVRWLTPDLQLLNMTAVPSLGEAQQRFAITHDPAWQPLVGIINKVLATMTYEQRYRIESRWTSSAYQTSSLSLLLSDSERSYLQQLGTLDIGVEAYWPPFEFIEDGQYQGMTAEFNRQIEESLGIRFNPVHGNDWGDTLERFKSGEIPLLSGVQDTLGRREYMLFSKPYLVHPYMILVHEKTRFVSSFDDLIGKKVATVTDYAIEEILRRERPQLELVSYPSSVDALLAVSAHKADAYVGLLGASSWLMEKYGINNVKVSAPTPYEYSQRVGISKEYPELVELINRAIDNIPAYQRRAIKNRWFRVQFEYQVTQDEIIRAVMITLTIIIPVLIVILIWNRKLKYSQEKLAEAKEQAEQASQFKSQFLANMSHEIRTPMNAIVGMNHLLLKSGLNERQQGYSQKIKQSATALLTVINDILDFSKVEAGHLDIESVPFNLHRVIKELADLMALKAAEKGVEILIDVNIKTPANLMGDPLRLGQVLINLTQNAIKFTDQGEVVVSVREIALQDNRVELEFIVEDTGIGIDPDQLHHLFEAFTQADGSSTRKYGGTGLGLNISQQLVKLMGGEITAISEPGKGSCFRFSLTFPVQTSAPAPFVTSAGLIGLRVLVIDDNQNARQILRDMLEAMSFRVDTLENGERALLQVRQQESLGEPYGLIIADWQMPGKDGVEVLGEIRTARLQYPPATLLITAYGRENVLASADAQAVSDFLIKPINASALFDAIMRLFVERHDKPLSDPEGHAWLQGQVLLVEDHEINQAVALEFLHSLGIIADTASNGAEAVEIIKQEKHYGLVLMDLQMPVMDGLQATALIRQDARFTQLPIIAMTAHAMQGDRERCLAAGMTDHIAKPIDPEQFTKVLRQWLPEAEAPPFMIERSDNEQQFIRKFVHSNDIDLQWGIERVGGNRRLYFNLLDHFYQKHHQDMALIQEAMEQQDFKKALRLVHTLRGVSANLGASIFAQDAAQLDHELRTGKPDVDLILNGLLWTRLRESAERLFTVIQSMYRQEYAAECAPTVNDKPHEDAHQILQCFQRLLLAGDAHAQHEMIQIQSVVTAEQFQQLRNLMNDYDYEQAAALITQVMEEL